MAADRNLPKFPHKSLDTAVAAHCGRDRLETGKDWFEHCAFRGIDVSHVVAPGDGAGERHRFYAKYEKGTIEPLHMHQMATTEWVVLSGKFLVEAGPIVPGRGGVRVRETVVAGSYWCVPKGQPNYVKCLEGGVIFVSYDGNPDMTFLKDKKFED